MSGAFKIIAFSIFAIAVIVCVWYATLLFRNPVLEDVPVVRVSSDLEQYFKDELVQRGVNAVGQPIEGFDSDVLLLAFPGLRAEDFDGVVTSEGQYEYRETELAFVRNGQKVTSAERAVSNAGYDVLLKNVANRMQLVVNDRAGIDELLRQISPTGDGISSILQVSFKETSSALGISITPLEILEDSRCPIDVQCIQAGTVRVRVERTDGSGTSTNVFTLNQIVAAETDSVTLVAVEPEVRTTENLLPEKYRFTFKIEKGETVNTARCYVGGCSAQLCIDSPGMASSCEFVQEYACYRNAVCERQSNGSCGWTDSEQLRTCLGSYAD